MRKDPRVTLYYADHAQARGYVTVTGRAVLVDDKAEIRKRKRDYWDSAFPGLENLVLVKVVPERVDVLNYASGLKVDPETWRTPGVDLVTAPAR
jgi:general stress protein 26